MFSHIDVVLCLTARIDERQTGGLEPHMYVAGVVH